MASSQDSNEHPRKDDSHSLFLAKVRALELELVKVCESDELSLAWLRGIINQFPANAKDILGENCHEWFSGGDTPLHAACNNKNVDVNIVKALLDFWPGSASIQNVYGENPTHVLLWNEDLQDEGSLEILKLLVKASPESLLSEADSKELTGGLPIHFAARDKPHDFCKLLLGVCPESVRMPTRCGSLPIHCACVGVGRLDTVKYLLDIDPESIHARDSDGDLPIHLAAMWSNESEQNEHADIIQFLLDQDPTCTMKSGRDQDLPLHVASNSEHVNLEAIELLFDSFPEALFTKNRNGLTTLDGYILGAESRYRYQIWRQNIIYPLDSMRRLAIDSIDSNNSVIRTFLEKQMDYALQAQDTVTMNAHDSKGWLPLHRALLDKASLGAIKLLVNGNEGAMRVAGKSCGSFPLHIACELCTVDIVRFLVGRYDGCLIQCDNNGNTPLHRACLTGNCSVVRYLLERHGTSVSTHNVDKKLPIHLLIESDVDRNSLAYQEAIFLLLQAHPQAVMNC